MSNLSETKRGRVWKFGDSVDTNQMAGGGLVGTSAADTLRISCLRGLRPEFTEQVKSGDIIIAGTNFGCGSSRQRAVEALKLCGVAAVLVESVARIHRRNSIALVLPTFVVPGITKLVNDGDEVEVDYENGVVKDLTRGGELPLPKFPSGVEAIFEAGGLLQVLVQRLAERGITVPAG